MSIKINNFFLIIQYLIKVIVLFEHHLENHTKLRDQNKLSNFKRNKIKFRQIIDHILLECDF